MEDHTHYYKSMEPNYIAMGRLLHAWDHVEGAWAFFFETLLKDHPLSQRTFFASSAFSAKANMIERLLEVSPISERERAMNALERCNRIGRRRNDVVHGTWIGVDASNTIRVAIKKDHDDTSAVAAAYISKKDQKLADRAYDADKMLKLADEIQALAEEVFAISENLRRANAQ